jgi:tetratricopeptide (TPR) repeat protein
MTGGRPLALVVLAAWAGLAPLGASPQSDADHLFASKQWAKAKAALEPIVAAEPSNAKALYELGMASKALGVLVDARTYVGRAVKLEPKDEDYLSDYAGICLLLADRDNSLTLALEGKDGMEKALAMDPTDTGAREALIEFYAKAPWPIGDRDRSMELAAELARQDPAQSRAAYLNLAGIFDKDHATERARQARERASAVAPPPKP